MGTDADNILRLSPPPGSPGHRREQKKDTVMGRDGDVINSSACARTQNPITQPHDEIPEVSEITRRSFEVHGNIITVTLVTASGELIRYTVSLKTFAMGVSASMAFINAHLGSFLGW